MRRRLKLTRGGNTHVEIGLALSNIGVPDGRDFFVEAEVPGKSVAVCQRCGEVVDPNSCWSEVHGFEKPRSAGGTNHVALREPTGVFLCDPCMALRRSGVPVGQESLV